MYNDFQMVKKGLWQKGRKVYSQDNLVITLTWIGQSTVSNLEAQYALLYTF